MAAPIRAFGEPVACANTGDNWCTIISCDHSAGLFGFFNGALCQSHASQLASNGSIYCCCSFSGTGSAIASPVLPLVGSRERISGADEFLGIFPSFVDGQLKCSQKILCSSVMDNTPRAIIPGLLHIPQQNLATTISAHDLLEGHGDMAGRRLLALPAGDRDYTAVGVNLIDITGPWR